VDNTITGAGQLGAGEMALVNQGSIIADGSHALTIDTGASTISNSGNLEATGPGGMVIQSAIDNSGLLWANGGSLVVNGNVTGTGSALISEAGSLELAGSSSIDVKFDTDASGILKLCQSSDFSGLVAGFNENSHID